MCEIGEMLIGENYEYYGRCECPEGYYKAGFTSSTCKKDEYVNEDWEQFVEEIDNAELN